MFAHSEPFSQRIAWSVVAVCAAVAIVAGVSSSGVSVEIPKLSPVAAVQETAVCATSPVTCVARAAAGVVAYSLAPDGASVSELPAYSYYNGWNGSVSSRTSGTQTG